MPVSVTSVPLWRTALTLHPGIGTVARMFIVPGVTGISNVQSARMVGGVPPPTNMGPLGTVGAAISRMSDGPSRPEGSGGLIMMRPCAVAGRWGVSTTPVMSSPPATFTVATEASTIAGPEPNAIARS